VRGSSIHLSFSSPASSWRTPQKRKRSGKEKKKEINRYDVSGVALVFRAPCAARGGVCPKKGPTSSQTPAVAGAPLNADQLIMKRREGKEGYVTIAQLLRQHNVSTHPSRCLRKGKRKGKEKGKGGDRKPPEEAACSPGICVARLVPQAKGGREGRKKGSKRGRSSLVASKPSTADHGKQSPEKRGKGEGEGETGRCRCTSRRILLR